MPVAAWLSACSPEPHAPRHFLAITHPALNRLTFFDLDERRVVGALPTQKLPHDMLLSPDGRTLFVVASGSQCMSLYDLSAPALWREAARFMRRDSVRSSIADTLAPGHPRVAMPPRRTRPPAPAPTGPILNPDPVQALAPAIVHHVLTDTLIPPRAAAPHSSVGAVRGRVCYDCHDRSVGGKPFGPMFSKDRTLIYLVQLAYRNIVVFDARSGAIRRTIPLDLPTQYAPVELWIAPGESTAFVTCRDEIGMSRRGRILVVDLASGAVKRSIVGGIYPWHMVPDASGRRLLVNNFQSSQLSVVDVERAAIVDSISVQNGPAAMAFLPGRGALAVTCFYTDRLLIVNLDTHKVEQTLDVGSNPTSLEISPDGRTAWILCGGEGALDVVDLVASRVIGRHRVLFGAYAFRRVAGI